MIICSLKYSLKQQIKYDIIEKMNLLGGFMEAIHCITGRRSIREFTEETVTPAVLEEVIDAADQRVVDAHGDHHGAAAYAGNDVGQADHHAAYNVQDQSHSVYLAQNGCRYSHGTPS